jgi:hypothetical protein
VAGTPSSEAAKSGKKGVQRFPNGFEIETLALGKPDGKLAKVGKKVRRRQTECCWQCSRLAVVANVELRVRGCHLVGLAVHVA